MEKIGLKDIEHLPLKDLIAQENLMDTLSTMNIWVYAWRNPEKVVAAITGVMESHGFGCTKLLENELLFQNENHKIHVVLLDKEPQIEWKEPSLETSEILSIAENLMWEIPIVIEPLEIISPNKPKKKTYNNNQKTTRIKQINTYKGLKHTKCARSPKSSGHNFKKGTKQW